VNRAVNTKTVNMDIDLSVEIANGKIHLPFCLYNASGPRSGTVEALQKVAQSKSGAVLTKSSTVSAQTGNPLPRTHHATDGVASFNSEGLPNNGIDYYISSGTIDSVLGTTNSSVKPYIVSLSGKCLNDNLEMIRKVAASPHTSSIASIELNLACPNVIGKPIIGYDMNQMKDTLEQVAAVIADCHRSGSILVPPLGIKLPPYLDFSHFHSVAELLNHYAHVVSYVVSINTIGNALCIDGLYMESPYISSNDGFAGLSGPAVKYTALANVCKLRELLLPSIDVVGVGGITSGQDVYDMILVGATCCQTATTHWKEGPACFDRIHQELTTIMRRKGHTSIRQVCNTLQPWSKDRANLGRQQKSLTTKNGKTMDRSTDNNQDANFYKMLSIMLIIIIAILLADDLLGIRLLPTESN
jgi:dihydroorotate dehydrogenase (fumarate)